MFRFFFALCTLVSALALPWWVPLVLSLYGAFKFPRFFEALVAGLIIDGMYGTHALFGLPGVATLCAAALLVVVVFIRRHVRHEILSKR